VAKGGEIRGRVAIDTGTLISKQKIGDKRSCTHRTKLCYKR
jgi:hypothetical protein